jgi:hypothetical protein
MSKCAPNSNCKDITTCEPQFRDKLCKCVVTKSDCETIKTVCAYEDGGVLYPCSVGCCKNQCDRGQCPENNRGSFKILGVPMVSSPNDMKKYALAILVLIIALVTISTLSL